MKVLISSLGLILGSSFSLATTHVFFNNATKVAIVIQGDDSDASRLYEEALNVEEHEIKMDEGELLNKLLKIFLFSKDCIFSLIYR